MTEKQLEIFDGLMLSDGHIKKVPRRCRTSFSMCSKHAGFVLTTSRSLPLDWAPMRSRSYFDKRTRKTYVQHSIRSRRSEWLKNERIRWYPSGNKVVPQDVRITPISVMWWYIGDGCLLKKATRPQSRRIHLATECFSIEDVRFLTSKLIGMLGDDNLYLENNNIIIARTAITKFSQLVGTRSPVQEYQYKFDFGQYLDPDYFGNSYSCRESVLNFGDRMKKINSKRVVRVESKEEFASLSEASKITGIPRSTLSLAIKTNKTHKGSRWEFKEN